MERAECCGISFTTASGPRSIQRARCACDSFRFLDSVKATQVRHTLGSKVVCFVNLRHSSIAPAYVLRVVYIYPSNMLMA